MNPYYEQLMAYKGAQELQAIIRRWDALSDNLQKRPVDAPIILPDLFMYTHPGFGNTKLLALMANYLESKGNLMTFYGDVKFFEYKLDYCEPKSQFESMYRFADYVEAAAGFRNIYKGLVRVNLDEWVGHHKEKYFLEFLQYLQYNTPHWLIVLTLSDTRENDKTKEMESVISMYLRLETITLQMPGDEELVAYAQEQLAQYGLTLDADAGALLRDSVAVLKKNRYFYGLHTVRDLCSDIVYVLFSATAPADGVITADMLRGFAADSEYIQRTIIKLDAKHKLGF